MPEIKPFTLSRIFNAPRDLVFKVNTDPAHLAKWFGPAGMEVIKADMDLRPGGMYHYGLRSPDGNEMWGKQVYREVVVPEKLVFIQSFSDKNGGLTRHPMSPTWPLEMLSTTLYEDLGDKTRMTVSWQPYQADDEALRTFDNARGGMEGGFKGMWDNLDVYLQTLRTTK